MKTIKYNKTNYIETQRIKELKKFLSFVRSSKKPVYAEEIVQVKVENSGLIITYTDNKILLRDTLQNSLGLEENSIYYFTRASFDDKEGSINLYTEEELDLITTYPGKEQIQEIIARVKEGEPLATITITNSFPGWNQGKMEKFFSIASKLDDSVAFIRFQKDNFYAESPYGEFKITFKDWRDSVTIEAKGDFDFALNAHYLFKLINQSQFFEINFFDDFEPVIIKNYAYSLTLLMPCRKR